jgi:UDP-N-acetylglucosamine transferase subunit ALG13
MILVLLGTNPYPFNRLLLAVDKWASATGEKVIAQVGHTKTPAPHLECYDFVPYDELMIWLKQSDLVISHGGFGSLRDCLIAGKPAIAVPRQPELGECQDIQSEVAHALAAEGRVLVLENMNDLAKTIEAARRMSIKQGMASRIPSIIAEEVGRVL